MNHSYPNSQTIIQKKRTTEEWLWNWKCCVHQLKFIYIQKQGKNYGIHILKFENKEKKLQDSSLEIRNIKNNTIISIYWNSKTQEKSKRKYETNQTAQLYQSQKSLNSENLYLSVDEEKLIIVAENG